MDGLHDEGTWHTVGQRAAVLAGAVTRFSTPGRGGIRRRRSAFSLTGEVLFSQLATPPPPLPRVALRDEDGTVQVYVPKLV